MKLIWFSLKKQLFEPTIIDFHCIDYRNTIYNKFINYKVINKQNILDILYYINSIIFVQDIIHYPYIIYYSF